MDIVSMGTIVISDMKNKFALLTTVMYLAVRKDILNYVVGFNNMEDVNLHPFASSSIRILKIFRN